MRKSHQTLLSQAGHYIDQMTGDIISPIYLSTTYARNKDYELVGDYIYGRYQNPTYNFVENLCSELDRGKDALVFASGMSAIATLFETLESNQHIVAPQVMYHGAQDWLRRISTKRNIRLTLFDTEDAEALKKAVRPGETAIVWIETPVNPTWDVIDIRKSAEIAHEAGAILAVDATVSTPITTMALEYGADLVFHSATKYLNGHSDVMAGILVTRELNERWDDIRLLRKYMGGVLGPVEAWLLLRGMRTLGLRFEKASDNALKFARHFEHHPKIQKMLYPGLPSHPGHDIAKKQMTNGFGGMISLQVDGGKKECLQIIKKLELFTPATSLGGVESLIEHRKTVEGPNSIVPDNLIRISIGTEEATDLIADFENALKKSQTSL